MSRSPRVPGPLSLVVCALAAAPALTLAQDIRAEQPVDPPAHVSLVEGTVVLERDGQSDREPRNMPLLAGDRLRTENGRAEILFADGGTLHLDTGTTVDFQSDELVRLLDGRIRIAIPGPSRVVSYRVDAPAGWAQITQPGEYRVSMTRGARGEELELAVIRGAAEIATSNGRTPLRAGERAYAQADAAPSYAYVFNSASWDAFDRWSEALRDRRLGVSAQYLPEEVRPYAASLDQYGSWRYESSYGYVWYPTVAVDWRPYYHGRWATLRPYGWTWIGADPWAWPTHHYGRWGFSAGAYFWIPGRTWGPAWVSWGYASNYVAWCPLGWNNAPLFGFNVSIGWGRSWHPWTFVPRPYFGYGYVHARAVPYHRIDGHVRGSFAYRSAPPDFRGYAVPRSAAPIRVAGTPYRGHSGTGVPVYTNLDRRDSRVGQDGRRVMVPPSGSVDSRTGSDRVRDASAPRAVARGASPATASSSGERSRSGAPGLSQQRAESPAVGTAVRRYEPDGAGRSRAGAPGIAQQGSEPSRAGTAVRRYEPNVAGAVRAPVETPASRAYPDYRGSAGATGERAVRRPDNRDVGSAPGMSSRPSAPAYSSPYGAGDRRRPDAAPPPAPGGTRAVPRGAMDAPRGPAPSQMERRGPVESRPGGGPGAAAPSPRGGDAGARPRPSGQPSAGTAVPRRRGGN